MLGRENTGSALCSGAVDADFWASVCEYKEWLGAEFDDLFLCSHPHLRTAPPYEDLEKEVLPGKVAERSAEFKLYLALAADRSGIPASALGSLAEPAARFIFKRLQLTDIYDWRSTLAAYASLDAQILQEVLPKQ